MEPVRLNPMMYQRQSLLGNNINEPGAYDYWDHVEWVVQEAAKRGIYMALVPVWGSNVKEGKVSAAQATIYGKFWLRFKNYSNIIWLNGGDIMGSDHKEVWEALGKPLRNMTCHLMTYHPRGRYTSGLTGFSMSHGLILICFPERTQEVCTGYQQP